MIVLCGLKLHSVTNVLVHKMFCMKNFTANHILHQKSTYTYRSVLGKLPWVLTRDITSICLHRSCYIDPLKCGTWALARDTTVVHLHPLLTKASSLFLFGLYMIPNSRPEFKATLYELPQPSWILTTYRERYWSLVDIFWTRTYMYTHIDS